MAVRLCAIFSYKKLKQHFSSCLLVPSRPTFLPNLMCQPTLTVTCLKHEVYAYSSHSHLWKKVGRAYAGKPTLLIPWSGTLNRWDLLLSSLPTHLIYVLLALLLRAWGPSRMLILHARAVCTKRLVVKLA